MIWFLVNKSFAIRYVFGIHFVTFKSHIVKERRNKNLSNFITYTKEKGFIAIAQTSSRLLKKGALLLSFKLCPVYQRKGL